MNQTFCAKIFVTRILAQNFYTQYARKAASGRFSVLPFIKVLKKEPFSGSHQGMRFFMRAEDDTLHVWVYPEPWCFEKTSDDMKTAKDFPFTQEGLDDSMEWISQEFENRKDYWMQMEKDKMKMILQGRGDS